MVMVHLLKLRSFRAISRAAIGRVGRNARVVMVFALLCMVSPYSVAQQAALASVRSATSSVHAVGANAEYEPAVLAVLDSLQAGRLELALTQVDAHLSSFPKSRIAHLLRADILKAQGGGLSHIGEGSALPAAELAGLTHQLKNRWQHNN